MSFLLIFLFFFGSKVYVRGYYTLLSARIHIHRITNCVYIRKLCYYFSLLDPLQLLYFTMERAHKWPTNTNTNKEKRKLITKERESGEEHLRVKISKEAPT